MVIEKKYYDIAQRELEEMQRQTVPQPVLLLLSQFEIRLEDREVVPRSSKSSEIHFFTKRCIGNCTKYADKYKN